MDMHKVIELPKPYTFHGPFAYSLRCSLCRMECEHTQLQHDALRFGIEVKQA